VETYDALVIGGGMAGVSIAYELAADRRVGLLDMEGTLAYHTTGRSAAMFLETYGGPVVRALARASRAFLTDPPDIVESGLLTPRPMLYTGRRGRGDAVRTLWRDVSRLVPNLELVDPSDLPRVQPLLRPEQVELALLEPGANEIDVHALHQGYVRGLRRRGGSVLTSAPVRSADARGDRWTITDGAGRTWWAPVVVNAAGAWADDVAALFGARSIGLRPLRRTAFMVDAPEGCDQADRPMIADVDDTFYVKPERGQLLCSPADETPQPPGDARPDELEIARAIDVINETTTLDVRHVRSSWAGLRSFVADRSPVVGRDPAVEGLFWVAGQGGFGIQIAPALARSGAALVRGEALPDDVASAGLTADDLAPDRAGLTRGQSRTT
jgi:D-arginine dehydrogenase